MMLKRCDNEVLFPFETLFLCFADPKKEAYADAIQEMMKRIKQGQTLKPVHHEHERVYQLILF